MARQGKYEKSIDCFSLKVLKVRDNLEDQGLDGKIKLNTYRRNTAQGSRLDWFRLGERQGMGSY